MIQAVFVYGTLKRGQCRLQLWPTKPLSICEGWTRGSLYTRHDYPAMRAGTDRVLGELWRFSTAKMPHVLEMLDQIEGTNQPGQSDLYLRIEVETWSLDGRPLESAYAYHYASEPSGDGFVRLNPGGDDRWVRWPAT